MVIWNDEKKKKKQYIFYFLTHLGNKDNLYISNIDIDIDIEIYQK